MKVGKSVVKQPDQRLEILVSPNFLEHEHVVIGSREMPADELKPLVDVFTPVQRNSPAIQRQRFQSHFFDSLGRQCLFQLDRLGPVGWLHGRAEGGQSSYRQDEETANK